MTQDMDSERTAVPGGSSVEGTPPAVPTQPISFTDFHRTHELRVKEVDKRHATWDRTYNTAVKIIKLSWGFTILVLACSLIEAKIERNWLEDREALRQDASLKLIHFQLECAGPKPSPLLRKCLSDQEIDKLAVAASSTKVDAHWYDRMFLFAPFLVLASASLAITIAFLRHGFMKEDGPSSDRSLGESLASILEIIAEKFKRD